MKNIKLNKDVSMDLEKLVDSRLLVQANSGAGKSWAVRRLLEQSHGSVQQIVIDPEGEFSTLREKYDYILAGKGGDVPADPRSAGLLATKLLELKVSAIIDLYELSPIDRKRFVRIFLDAMTNAPKDLWHPVLVVIDEAHIFAPEKGESEAMGAVIDLATRGRKRGFCAVLATQRISKLHKDAAAECNNKLIGRAGLDIDRKRASEELGFTTKEQNLSLRSLEPGHFFAFGPAISDEVIELQVGPIETTHPKAGSRILSAVTPPTPGVKKILAKLADLPQEAAKEAKTMGELKDEITRLKRANSTHKQGVLGDFQQKIVEKSVKEAKNRWFKEITPIIKSAEKYQKDLLWMIDHLYKSAHAAPMPAFENVSLAVRSPVVQPGTVIGTSKFVVDSDNKFVVAMKHRQDNIEHKQDDMMKSMILESPIKFGAGEKKVLTAIAQHEEGLSREHITIVAGYKRSTRDAYLQRLSAAGYIHIMDGGRISVTGEGMEKLGPDFQPLPTGRELLYHLLATLPEGEMKILRVLADAYPESVPRDTITEMTGYMRSTRDAYIQRLTARQLVSSSNSGVIAAAKLFE